MPHHRAAYTLIELVIAVAILAVASVAVMENMVASRHLSSHAAAKDELELDAMRIMSEISADLTASGWDFCDDGAAPVYSGVAQTVDRQLRYYPMVQVQPAYDGSNTGGFNTDLPWTRLDPSLVRLPAVERINAENNILPGSPADALAGALAEAAWNSSFFARSAGLVFLRAFNGTWPEGVDPGSPQDQSIFASADDARYVSLSPSQRQRPVLNFSLDPGGRPLHWEDWRTANNHASLNVLFTSGFTETTANSNVWTERFPGQPYGVTLDAGWYDWGDVENAPIKPAWESMRRPNMDAVPVVGTMTELERRRAYMLSPQRYREYAYVVVPSPRDSQLGLGRLVRAYRTVNADAIPVGVEPGQRISLTATDSGAILTENVGLVVDKVLSDDVVRIVFDTYRTVDEGQARVSTLDVNQVRVRLFLAKRQVSKPDVVLSKIATRILGMRARNSAGDVTAITTTLGVSPIGLAR